MPRGTPKGNTAAAILKGFSLAAVSIPHSTRKWVDYGYNSPGRTDTEPIERAIGKG